MGTVSWLFTLDQTTVGAVKSGPAPVWKDELYVTGLPTWSITPLMLMVRVVPVGSGELGTNSMRVSFELNQ